MSPRSSERIPGVTSDPSIGRASPCASAVGRLVQFSRKRFGTLRLAALLAVAVPTLGNGECNPAGDDDSADMSVEEGFATYCAENPSACDQDEDGYMDDEDCDPRDSDTHAGATEIPYDGADQNCDGEDLADVDGDGFDSTEVAGGDDCDDGNETVHPGAPEVCDGDDQDCDGVEDEAADLDPDDPDTTQWGPDQDGDGEPECTNPITNCEQPDDIAVPGGEEIKYLECDPNRSNQ